MLGRQCAQRGVVRGRATSRRATAWSAASARASEVCGIERPPGPRTRSSRIRFSLMREQFCPNGGLQCHVAKVSARVLAKAKGRQKLRSRAVDEPALPSSRERPYLKDDKVRWLICRGANCGKLRGMHPLAVGVPLALVDRLGRSPEKLLLWGRGPSGPRRGDRRRRGRWSAFGRRRESAAPGSDHGHSQFGHDRVALEWG